LSMTSMTCLVTLFDGSLSPIGPVAVTVAMQRRGDFLFVLVKAAALAVTFAAPRRSLADCTAVVFCGPVAFDPKSTTPIVPAGHVRSAVERGTEGGTASISALPPLGLALFTRFAAPAGMTMVMGSRLATVDSCTAVPSTSLKSMTLISSGMVLLSCVGSTLPATTGTAVKLGVHRFGARRLK